MADTYTIINGVTKRDTGEGIVYYHTSPYHIRADVNEDSFTIQSDVNTGNPVKFSDISDKLGASNIVEYLDAAITEGKFKAPVTGDGEALAELKETNQTLSNWENNGIPLRSELGNAFALSKGADLTLNNINTGDDTLAYLFRVKAGASMAVLRSFFISVQSNSNDRYEMRLSANPTFSNYTIDDANFQDVVDPSNSIQSNLQFARAGELGVPNLPVINGYNEAAGGRLMLPKYGENQETMDSRAGFQVVQPQGAYFALSILPSSDSADVRISVNWNE